MRTRFDRAEARTLRRRGYSLKQLSQRLGISKSTASLWTKDVEIGEVGLDRIRKNRDLHREMGHMILRSRKRERLIRADEEAAEWITKVGSDTATQLAVLAMMYWCEGIKKDVVVGFTNSDPQLCCAFIHLLERVFSIDRSRIRVTIHIHDYHDEKETIAFWAAALRISIDQFTRPYRKRSDHKHKKEGYMGCARIAYGDAHVARVLMAFAKKLITHYI